MARPISITLTPAALDANGISASETLVVARLSFLISGALSTGFDRNGISVSQTPAAGGVQELTITGVLATGGTAFLDATYGQYITVFAAADDTARTITVTGRGFPKVLGLGKSNVITETITGPGLGLTTIGSTLFSEVSSVTVDDDTAGAIEIGVNGYVAFTTPQHYTITSAGDDTGDTFTVTGEDREGVVLTETTTGLSAAAALGLKNFAVIQRIVSSGASAAGVQVGVNGLCESRWVILDRYNKDFNVGFSGEVSLGANLTYGVQHTFENVFDLGEDAVTAFPNATVSTETTNQDGNYTNPPFAMRMQIAVHTSGSATLNVIQAG